MNDFYANRVASLPPTGILTEIIIPKVPAGARVYCLHRCGAKSVIVTLPTFSALIAHLGGAQFDWLMIGMTSVTAIAGAYYGSMFMAKRVKSRTLSRVFAAALVLLAVQRILILLTS